MLAAALIGAGGPSAAARTAEQETAETIPHDYHKNNGLALKVLKALHDAPVIKLEGTLQNFSDDGTPPEKVLGGVKPVSFTSYMTADSFRTETHDDYGRLIKATSLHDDEFREFVPALYSPSNEAQFIFYPAPEPYGTPDSVLKTATCCMTSSLNDAWASPFSNKAEYYADLIRHSTQQADEIINDRDCFVFFQQTVEPQAPIDHEGVWHKLYVDKETYLPVRWVTSNFGIRRVRDYNTTRLEEMPKSIDLSLEDLSLGKKPVDFSELPPPEESRSR